MGSSTTPGTPGTPGRLADGQPVALLAEIGHPGEVPAALAAGAEGALLRREFVDSAADRPPSAEVHQEAYAAVFAAFPRRRVVAQVREPAPLDPGPNPALGPRGIRALRAHEKLLTTQLAAIARAAAGAGDVWAAAPMVTDVEEAAWFVEEARYAGVANPGVLVQVPAAALLSGALLRTAAFAVLDTSELTQFTLAADRGRADLGAWHDPWHPAVLRLVELVGASGSLAGKPVDACGPAATDPLLACVLVGLGVTSLALPPAAIAAVRAELGRHRFADCLRYAELASRASSAADARRRVAAAASAP